MLMLSLSHQYTSSSSVNPCAVNTSDSAVEKQSLCQSQQCTVIIKRNVYNSTIQTSYFKLETIPLATLQTIVVTGPDSDNLSAGSIPPLQDQML